MRWIIRTTSIARKNDRPSTPHWPLLTAVLIGLPVLYVLSCGPVYWLVFQAGMPEAVQESILPALGIYLWPLQKSREYGPAWWEHTIQSYLRNCGGIPALSN